MSSDTTPFVRRALRVLGLRLFHLAENNGVSDVRRNGEAWLARELMRRHARRGTGAPFTVVDAGANTGDYTAMIFELARDTRCEARVHAFEPSAVACGKLAERFRSEPRLVVVGKAVGEETGRALLHGGAGGSSQASLVRRDAVSSPPAGDVPVEVVTLANYLEEAGLSRVDLLKLDVEGFERAALRGLGDALGPARVGVIQFEYGGTTLDAGVTLRDLYSLLRERGYEVAKLFPRGLARRGYAPWMEHFNYANYVALGPEERL